MSLKTESETCMFFEKCNSGPVFGSDQKYLREPSRFRCLPLPPEDLFSRRSALRSASETGQQMRRPLPPGRTGRPLSRKKNFPGRSSSPERETSAGRTGRPPSPERNPSRNGRKISFPGRTGRRRKGRGGLPAAAAFSFREAPETAAGFFGKMHKSAPAFRPDPRRREAEK